MTLRILQPQSITAANITASNVALETLWVAGTYALGDQRRKDDMLWEVSAATTTQTPSADATDWFSLGPANRYRAFDQQVGIDQYRVIETLTENADTITYTLDGLGQIMGFGFFGVDASSIRIVASIDTPGDVLDLTYNMQDATQYNGSFWRWVFLLKSVETKYINLAAYVQSGATVEITIDNTGNTARVGSIVMGVVNSFGKMQKGASRSIRSRSIKKTDGTLTSLLRRLPSASIRYDVFLADYRADAFWQLMDALDGVAAVFAGPDNQPDLATYGFHTNVKTTAEVNGFTYVDIEVESL
jgi:hypothetical protein